MLVRRSPPSGPAFQSRIRSFDDAPWPVDSTEQLSPATHSSKTLENQNTVSPCGGRFSAHRVPAKAVAFLGEPAQDRLDPRNGVSGKSAATSRRKQQAILAASATRCNTLSFLQRVDPLSSGSRFATGFRIAQFQLKVFDRRFEPAGRSRPRRVLSRRRGQAVPRGGCEAGGTEHFLDLGELAAERDLHEALGVGICQDRNQPVGTPQASKEDARCRGRGGNRHRGGVGSRRGREPLARLRIGMPVVAERQRRTEVSSSLMNSTGICRSHNAR